MLPAWDEHIFNTRSRIRFQKDSFAFYILAGKSNLSVFSHQFLDETGISASDLVSVELKVKKKKAKGNPAMP